MHKAEMMIWFPEILAVNVLMKHSSIMMKILQNFARKLKFYLRMAHYIYKLKFKTVNV